MTGKTIVVGPCPERLRTERLLHIIKRKRVDPTLLFTHRSLFDEMEWAFEVTDKSSTTW